jgi:hypothetical protein
MTRIETRLRLLWLALACATLAAGVAGCGGGGGGSVPPPPPPQPPASESAYLLAEFVAADGNSQSVRVWDPAQPAVAVQDIKLVMSNGIAWASSHLVFSDARTYDAATRTFTTLGHAKVIYDNDGKLYSVDLRGGQSHAPVRLSSAVDVFLPVSATPMNAAGDDAWVDAQGGSHDWAIRTTMSATTAPVSMRQMLSPLRDAATGVPQAFFAALGAHVDGHLTATTYQVFDASFAPVALPAIAAMVASDTWVGVDPAQPGLGYVGIAGHLRALRWSAGSVTVDADDLYDFAAPGVVVSTADARSLWFNDGVTLVGVANGAAQVAGTFSQIPSQLFEAGDTVAAGELTTLSVTQTATQVETLRKADGRLTRVASATSDLVLLGVSDQGLVIAGTSEAGRAVSLVSGDKTRETTLGASLQFVGAVRSASARVDQPAAPVAVLACVAGPVDGFCAPGSLTQVALSGSTVSVGTLAAAAPWVRGDAIAGLPSALAGQTFLGGAGGFGDDETDHRDAWQFTPSASGSLTRITSNVP